VAGARLGRGALPRYKQVLGETRGWLQILDAALGLGAIALRHTGSAAEVRRILLSYEEPPEGKVDMEAAAAGPRTRWRERSRRRRNASRPRLARPRVLRRRRQAPAGGSPAALLAARGSPRQLARTAALSFDADTWDPTLRGLLFVVLPVAARASAEDFYFPRDVLRAWHGVWRPQEALERLTRISKTTPKQEPLRAVSGDWSQRTLPLRKRQEVEEVPRGDRGLRSSRTADSRWEAEPYSRRRCSTCCTR